MPTAAARNGTIVALTDEDAQDHIGSNVSTPASGVATPRPDPADKRLPGIMHSYFGQVRASSSSIVGVSDSAVLVTPGLEDTAVTPMPEHHREQILPMESSPEDIDYEDSDSPPLLPHERVGASTPERHAVAVAADADADAEAEAEAEADADAEHAKASIPTPPISSPSSLHKEIQEASVLVASVKSSSPPTAAKAKEPFKLPTPLHARRHTFAIPNPLSSILTPSTVHAAYISTPPSRLPATTPTTPTASTFSAAGPFAAVSSYFDIKRLTEGGWPRKKNTPPHTPRSSSKERMRTEKLPAAPQTIPLLTGLHQAFLEKNGNDKTAASQTDISSTSTASIGPPKGKLLLKISRARGLRPSRDPYVVCVFEWNEYISKGPKTGDMDMDHDGKDGLGGVPIRRSGSDMGRPIAIPMKSRQSSNTSSSDQKEFKEGRVMTDPKWDHEAVFDVVGDKSEIDISVYDRTDTETFLGHVRLCPILETEGVVTDGWFELAARGAEEQVSGEIYLQIKYQTTDKRHYGPEDFQILKLIGKGTFGQVYQVRKKDTQRIYAMKVLSKKVIVKKKEVAHTLGERNILVRTAMTDSPFIVGLKFSFQTPTDLYLVTDYMSGGELFWHLQKEGKFNEKRAKFYIAELILALQHLHQHDIVYRDLKPENILLDANGHVALCDFGLSKANLTKNDTTNTFCGTTEYLAPEVLLDEQGYTKMVDFWSLGVLVFEMCCGWSPFYADDTQQMYKNIAFGKVRFPRDALSSEGRNFVKGLLNRNPRHRLGATHDAEELKAHAFFQDVDWVALAKKDVVPPFKPKLKSVLDTSNFDPEFTNALNGASSLNARAAALASGVPTSTPLSPGMQANFKGFTFVDESTMEENFRGRWREDLEKMDEDTKEVDSDDPDDDEHSGAGVKIGQRMSGVVRTGGDNGIFNDDAFDI